MCDGRRQEMPHRVELMVARILIALPSPDRDLGGQVSVGLLRGGDQGDELIHSAFEGLVTGDLASRGRRLDPLVEPRVLPMRSREFAIRFARGDLKVPDHMSHVFAFGELQEAR